MTYDLNTEDAAITIANLDKNGILAILHERYDQLYPLELSNPCGCIRKITSDAEFPEKSVKCRHKHYYIKYVQNWKILLR